MKSFLKIAIGISCIFFISACHLPDTKNDQIYTEGANDKETTKDSKKEKEKARDKESTIELKSEWYATKDSKKERLIEKRIDGEWDRTFSIRYDTKTFDKETYEFGKGNYYHEKYRDGMLPKYYYEFSSQEGIKKNDKPLSYSVDKAAITFINLLAKNEKENVLFIGKGLMVRNAEINPIKLGSYDFYRKTDDGVVNDYQNELKDFLISLFQQGGEQVKIAASLINQGRQNEGFSKLTDGVSSFRIVTLADTSMKKGVSELLAVVKTEFSSNFETYVDTQIVNLKQQISNSKSSDWKIEYLEKFQTHFSYLNNLKFIASTIGANTSKIDKTYKEIEKTLDAETKNLKLYGDGKQGMMKYAALDYIKMIAKNPKSIEVIRSGVSKKSSKGIVYTVFYRGQNSFGGYTIETISVLLNFDIGSRTYFVVRQL